MTLAKISKHGSIVWLCDLDKLDYKTSIAIQMFAESVARYQSIKAYEDEQKQEAKA